MPGEQHVRQGFTIFRAENAPGLLEAGCMSFEPITPVQQEGIDKALQAGFGQGEEVKVLCNIPGFSLAYAWFKKGFPLPLHSHDVDCLYYIIAGSVKLGTEQLGPRDSFFVPANVPYTYTPGEDGVEVLEFRHANQFNFVNLAKGEAFWKRAAQTAAENQIDWAHAERPTARADVPA